MKMAPKITLIIGAIMLLGSIVAMIVGIGSIDLENGDNQIYTGEAPTDWESELRYTSIYFVYVEEGSNVSAEIVGGNTYNRFIPCGEDFSCENHNTRVGYTYIGDLSVEHDGEYLVQFSGEGGVLVTELEIEIGGLMAIGFGFWCGCCSVLVLIVGLIMALVMKDNQVAQVVVMPGQVQAVPVAGVSPVPIGIDYSDPAQSYYANMMAQGFDSAQAAEITREQYPGFNQ